MTIRVHNREGYKRGCKCDVCRKAQSDYRKDLAQRHRAGTVGKPKRALTSVSRYNPMDQEVGGDALNGRSFEPSEPGPVESAVLLELGGLSTAVKRPGLAASALAMARLLDSPLNSAQHPGAQNRLQSALGELRRGADSRRSWLADVRKMTPRSDSEAG